MGQRDATELKVGSGYPRGSLLWVYKWLDFHIDLFSWVRNVTMKPTEIACLHFWRIEGGFGGVLPGAGVWQLWGMFTEFGASFILKDTVSMGHIAIRNGGVSGRRTEGYRTI